MTTSGCATWSPASPSRPPTSAPAETSAAQAVSRSACCTHSRWAPTGSGSPTTTAARRTATCWRRCWRARTSTRWPRSRRWCATSTTRTGWRSRCVAGWCGAAWSANCAPRARAKTCCRGSRRCSTARCSARPRSRPSACRTCGCSCAATRWSCTAGWSARACRSEPVWTQSICTRAGQTSSSRSSAAGCTPSTPTTRPSGSTPTAIGAICCPSRDCASCCRRSGCGSAGTSWCPAAIPRGLAEWVRLRRQGRRERFEKP